ncbi:hypothetical protein C0J52_06368 [Blattella germanica]|nr:hypothetical protein C0J52_06368 [Blattella germanica]
MSEEQQFCLRWNNFQANITSQFEALRDEEDFVDVTLACDGQRLKAHKVVLSACSPYFKELFKSNPCKHPILFLRDVAFHHLRALVEFMYAGEVNVAQAQLSAFLRTAESLQIRGLTEAPQRHKQAHIRQQQQQHQQTSVPSEITTGVGIDSSSAAEEVASSPECVGIDDDDDALSLSPGVAGGGTSPTPAKRQCLQQDGSEAHQRSQTSTSSSDLRQEIEAVTKDNPAEIVEVLNYSSDGESKAGTAALLGLDSNSVDVNASFAAALHGGGMDLLPGPSGQSFLGESSSNLDSGQVDHRKLHSLDPRPCPICNRMYSNLSNLRQHVRLIHNPQTVACPLCSKPFKTKLYLKRHLMSFHELLCTNNGPGGPQMVPKQNTAEFYPPPPQVYLGSHTVGEEEDGRKNSDGMHKGKDPNFLEIFNVSRGNMVHNPMSQSNHEEKSLTHKNKDSPDVFHHRTFQSGIHSHEDKQNFNVSSKVKHNVDLFQMPRMFHNIISSQSNCDDKGNYLGSGGGSQLPKPKDGQLVARNFHSEEDKSGFHVKNKDLQQGHNSDYFHAPSSRNFGNGDDRSVYGGAGSEKEVPSYASHNHKDENFISPQNRSHDKSSSSGEYRSPKQENSSCSNFMGALSLTSNENARLPLMPSGEAISYNNQDGSNFLDESFSHGKQGQHESSIETECLNPEPNN